MLTSILSVGLITASFYLAPNCVSSDPKPTKLRTLSDSFLPPAEMACSAPRVLIPATDKDVFGQSPVFVSPDSVTIINNESPFSYSTIIGPTLLSPAVVSSVEALIDSKNHAQALRKQKSNLQKNYSFQFMEISEISAQITTQKEIFRASKRALEQSAPTMFRTAIRSCLPGPNSPSKMKEYAGPRPGEPGWAAIYERTARVIKGGREISAEEQREWELTKELARQQSKAISELSRGMTPEIG